MKKENKILYIHALFRILPLLPKCLLVVILSWSICYTKKHSSAVWYMRKLLEKWLFGNGTRIVSLEFSGTTIIQRRREEKSHNSPLPSYWNGWQEWRLSVLSLWRKCRKWKTTAKQQSAGEQTQQPLTASLEHVQLTVYYNQCTNIQKHNPEGGSKIIVGTKHYASVLKWNLNEGFAKLCVWLNTLNTQ